MELLRPAHAVSDEDIHFVAQARALVPHIRTAAAKLSALANINRAVHQNTYNAAIAAAAQRIGA